MSEVVVSGNKKDSGRDVAIIKVNIKNAPSLLLADSERVQVKQEVTAVGYPGVGDIPKQKGVGYNQPSFTDGKVSAQKYVNGVPVLQVSAPIAPGNSGGPVRDFQKFNSSSCGMDILARSKYRRLSTRKFWRFFYLEVPN